MTSITTTRHESAGLHDGTVSLLLRSVKPQRTDEFGWLYHERRGTTYAVRSGMTGLPMQAMLSVCPWQVGDVLVVRETWAAILPALDVVSLRECHIEYRADTNAAYPGDWPAEEARGNPEAPKWRPSTQMPLWASRTTIRVTSIACVRVTDLTDEQIIAAGVFDIRWTQVDNNVQKHMQEHWQRLHGDAIWAWAIGVERA